MEELNNIIIEQMKHGEDEEKIKKEEETLICRAFQNVLKNKTYKSDKSYRIQDRKYLNNEIITLNKKQRIIFDEMLHIRDDKPSFLYLYGKARTGQICCLKIHIPALEFKSLKYGVDLNKPFVSFMSPTAIPATNLLYSDTLLCSLRMTSFQNLKKKCWYANAKLSSEMCQLIYIITDKICMVDKNFCGTSIID